MHVMIADADLYERLGLRSALEGAGHAVHEVADEASALALAARQELDAAIVDISIPPDGDGDTWVRNTLGVSLAHQLKSQRPELGVVLYSAYEHHLDEFLALLSSGLRGVAYCLKGRRQDSLLETLNQVTAGRVEIDPEVHTRTQTLANELRLRLTPTERPWVERAVAALPKLTAQEARAAMLLAASCSPEGVARRLSLQRADNLICRVYAKLGLDTVPHESPELRQVSLVIKACHIHMLQGRPS